MTGLCNDDFSILHLNPRSLNKNIDSIHNFISSFNHAFSVISLSETWFNEDGSNLIHFEDYILVNAPRMGRRSGGVAIYVHNSLSYRIRDDLKLCTTDMDLPHSESLFIEILSPTTKNTVIGTIYRAHRTDVNLFISDLDRSLNTIAAENKNCYVSGDFNLDLLLHSENNLVNDFLETFYHNNMYPLIDRPTRVTPSSATLIDNIFTNVFSHQIKSGVCVVNLTDHFPIFQCTKSMPLKFIQPHVGTTRSYNQNSIEHFHNHLKLIDWKFITDMTSADGSYDAFNSKFLQIYNIYFPVKAHGTSHSKNRSIPRKPWITALILKSIHRKEKLHRKYVCHPTSSNKNAYISYRNKLTTLIRTAKKNFYTNKLENSKRNSKLIWNILNDILGRKKKQPLPSFFYDENDPQCTDN